MNTRTRKANFQIPLHDTTVRIRPLTAERKTVLVCIGDTINYFGGSGSGKITHIFHSNNPATYLKVNGMRAPGGKASDTYIQVNGITKSVRHCWIGDPS
jgi:hypothetical protein